MTYRLLAGFSILFLVAACTGQKKTGVSRKNAVKVVPDDAVVDSADYFDNEYSVTYIPDKKKIEGRWNIQTMYRRSNPGAEKLINVTLTLVDSAFAGKAPCNSIAGTYILHGVNIEFKDIISTKMACGNLEQETIYLNLLQNSVATFGFKDNRLLLKDRMGNIVFECLKDQ
jgi:heat shock protein HslJ